MADRSERLNLKHRNAKYPECVLYAREEQWSAIIPHNGVFRIRRPDSRLLSYLPTIDFRRARKG